MSNDDEVAGALRGDCDLSSLFERNRAWANEKTKTDPSFFSRLVGQQSPRYFWIGCSDSRVPATEIVDLDPGEMFVHRNIANLTKSGDPSFSAALEFAVDVLEVQHILVVGHYGCGGIKAAMEPESDDAVGRWLKPVRALHQAHSHEHASDAISPNALCEQNVIAQVKALTTNPTIQAAWARKLPLVLHGWVYAIGDGLLRTVCDSVAGPR